MKYLPRFPHRMLLLLLVPFIFTGQFSFAQEPCAVVVGFNWTPPSRVGSDFSNPTISCAEKLSDPQQRIFSASPIPLPSTQETPLDMKTILNTLRSNYPGCSIIGLGYFDAAYREPPFTDANGIPVLPIEVDVVGGTLKYVPKFPPRSRVRAEVSGLNLISTVGGFVLANPEPVDVAGKAVATNPAWISALEKCSKTNPETFLGFDRDGGGDACNQESYLLAQERLGGFLHISDCSDETLKALRKMVSCLKTNFSP